MKIAINAPIEIEFDSWSLQEAEKILGEVRTKHGERADNVFRGLLTLIGFMQLEAQHPGSVANIQKALDRAAEST